MHPTARPLARLALLSMTAAAGVVVAAPATPASAYYSAGVKSLHFAATTDTCDHDLPYVCTPGAGQGEANVITVHQTPVGPGEYEYSEVRGTGSTDGHVWLAAEFGAECRTGYRLFHAQVEMDDPESTDNWNAVDEVGIWTQNLAVPTAKSVAAHTVAIDVPLGTLFSPTYSSPAGPYRPIAGYDSLSDVLAVGEAEIAERVAAGASELGARGDAFHVDTFVTVKAEVVCRGEGWLHLKRRQEVLTNIPVRVEYVPLALPDQVGVADDVLADASVTSVDLTVTRYEDGDPCTLVLAGTIGTTGPTDVEYRFVNQYGQPSNTYTARIDGPVGFVQHEVAVPHLDAPDPDGDLAVAPGRLGGPATDLVGNGDGDAYSGTFELQVLSPNSMSAVDGFSVDHCPYQVADIDLGGHQAYQRS